MKSFQICLAALLLVANVFAGEAYDPAKATGTIKGTVLWEGDVLKPRKTKMGDAECVKCQKAEIYTIEDAVVKDGKLANAFVFVSKGQEKWNFEGVKMPDALIDQKCCVYTPHAVALKTGQALSVQSSDPWAHNIHIIPAKGKEQNFSQSTPGIAPTKPKYDEAELGIKVQCDVHSHMSAFICVFDHSLFAVTKEDGSFEIKVPPGKYTLGTWHESKVQPKKISSTVTEPAPEDVTVEDGKTVEVKLVYKRK